MRIHGKLLRIFKENEDLKRLFCTKQENPLEARDKKQEIRHCHVKGAKCASEVPFRHNSNPN